MELRHYIDGQLVEEPNGWGDFTEDIKRNYKSRLIGTEYPIDITFVGSGYAALDSLYADNPCGIVTYVVKQRCEQAWEDAMRSAIVLADVEFNLDRCEAKVKATDDGIGARINNNRGIEVFPKAEQTKTNAVLVPATAIPLEVFSTPLGGYLPDVRRAYDWKEAMRHCVSYITDLNVTIVSDWYDALPDDERYAVVDGRELRAFDDQFQLKTTFELLFNELGKKYNLWAAVERDVSGNPVLRIEQEGHFYGAASTVSFPETRDLIRKVDPGRIYAFVKVGSTDYIKDYDGTFSIPFLVMRGFTEERLPVKCECNTDEELDLVNKWIIDSNVIQDVVVNANTEWDEKVFLIQYDQTTNKATKGSYIFAGFSPFGYNEQLQNFRVLNRWSFPCSVGMDTADPEEGLFAASLTNGPAVIYSNTGFGPGPTVTSRVRFNNDYSLGGFDPSNNYGNGTAQGTNVNTVNSRYDAPAQGYYLFTTFVRFHLAENHTNDPAVPSPVSVRATIYLQRFNAANVVVDTGPVDTVDMYAVNTYDLITTAEFVLEPGDYVAVTAEMIQIGVASGINPITVYAEAIVGSFALETSTLGGGGVVNMDPNAFYSTLYVFERHCTLTEWKELRDDLSLSVAVGTRPAQMFRGYPKDASRNLKTGATKWEIIANRI